MLQKTLMRRMLSEDKIVQAPPILLAVNKYLKFFTEVSVTCVLKLLRSSKANFWILFYILEIILIIMKNYV